MKVSLIHMNKGFFSWLVLTGTWKLVFFLFKFPCNPFFSKQLSRDVKGMSKVSLDVMCYNI